MRKNKPLRLESSEKIDVTSPGVQARRGAVEVWLVGGLVVIVLSCSLSALWCMHSGSWEILILSEVELPAGGKGCPFLALSFNVSTLYFQFPVPNRSPRFQV